MLAPKFRFDLLTNAIDHALINILKLHNINGFAIVYEIGQPQPTFNFAINTESNGQALPSTGEWDYPADDRGEFSVIPEWGNEYNAIDDYLSGDDENESRYKYVMDNFIRVMIEVKSKYNIKIPGCIFTVNECNDSDEVIESTFKIINDVANQ